ncbi:MAG: beta-ketoacyl synthase N-terminal-like domain-containing protein [Thermodesulfovibrionales bacterium]
MTEAVVITGAGITTSLGHTVADVWTALLSGQSGIGLFRSDDSDVPSDGPDRHAAALVSGLDPAGLGLHPRDARIMGKHALMLIKASRDAHAAARIDRATVAPEDIGFYAGMGMVDYAVDDLLPCGLKSLGENGSIDYDRFYAAGYREIYPLWPLSMLNNISFCQAAIGLTIRGENTVFSPHADSGALAIAEGVWTILENRARLVLAGGVSEVVSPLSLARGNFFGILAAGTGGKTVRAASCSPFGISGQGTVLGEGCGIISLELRSNADKRGASYGTMITGYGMSCSRDTRASCPSAYGIRTAMEHALKSAELGPPDIDLIIAHGDGTLHGDRNEAEAIQQVFAECPAQPNVYSSKAALGNLLAGAAPVDIILGSRMIEQGIVPPIAGPYSPDSSLKVMVVKDRPVTPGPQRIMINASSYEGQCSTIIIEAAGKSGPRGDR